MIPPTIFQAPTSVLLGGKRGYRYTPGTLPVCLVAHVDTVHPQVPAMVYHDPAQEVMWAPEGLGADDRAGVWAIQEIQRRGFQPHVLLCDGEESGGIGARQALAGKVPLAGKVRLLIELDRRGATDAVYYDCGSQVLRKWVSQFGRKEADGSFSDISVLGPAWNLAAVNLSVGYYQEHTRAEYLNVRELRASVDTVCEMLRNLPDRTLPHETVFRPPCGGYRGLLPGLREGPLLACPKPQCVGMGQLIVKGTDYAICEDCQYIWSVKGGILSRGERKRIRKHAKIMRLYGG